MPHQKREGLFKEVYKVIRKIPKGKVSTYGQIAKIVGTTDARKVGWALHANRSEDNPCHRVVSKEGALAKNFGFSLPTINRSSRRVRISKAWRSKLEPESREGRLGGDGWEEQKRRLLAEGVKFKDKMRVDLENCLWNLEK